MHDIYSFLAEQGISYEKCEHPAVFTCEEAERLVPALPGMHTKNLFVRDKKGERFFLIVVDYEKSVDLKKLGEQLEVKGLRFASPEKLKEFLGVEPGSATVLGIFVDTQSAVKVVFDKKIWEAKALQCHPLVNTATLVLSHEDIEKFLHATNHQANVIDVPAREG
jgi:Ala-tRNA(Pro) deacylase